MVALEARGIDVEGTPYGRRAAIGGWLYAIPALACFAGFMVFPIFYNLVNSLGVASRPGLSWHNYVALLHDPVFHIALGNSVLWMVATTLVQMALGFGLAVFLETWVPKGKSLFRTLLFLPMAVTPTVIAIVFENIYAPAYGLLFGLFRGLGQAQHFPALLAKPATATYALMAVNVWQWVGFYVLMYSVAIASIDPDVLAAADVDGATGWRRVRHILFPLVRSTHLSLLILGGIQALQQFPLIYLMTEGGPANATQVLATYIFLRGYVENDMHYASAVSVILLVLALMVAALQLYASGGDFSIGGGRRRGQGL